MQDQLRDFILRDATLDDTAQIIEWVKMRRSKLNRMGAAGLVIGDQVKFTSSRSGQTVTGRVEKIAIKNVIVYKRTGSNPLSSCLPLLIQMPIFGGLFFTLNEAQHDKAGVFFLTKDLAESFSKANLFGAKLSETFLSATSVNVQVLAAIMVVTMTVTQFITQKQIMAKNQNPDSMNSQYMQTQKIMLVLFPIIFAISGISFPIGVMFYWLASNFWTMGQQFIVIRNMPAPGSPAFEARQARLAAKGIRPEGEIIAEGDAAPKPEPKGQRQQPSRKKPKKK